MKIPHDDQGYPAKSSIGIGMVTLWWYKRLEVDRLRGFVSPHTDGEPVILVGAIQLTIILGGIGPIVVE